MNKAIARRWARALRSGKYTQGCRYLKQKDANGKFLHCGLGVLCELYQADRVRKKRRKLNTRRSSAVSQRGKAVFSFDEPRMGYDYVRELPPTVQRWAGMISPLGRYRYGGATLVNDNDIWRKSFQQIATIIEKNVAKL